MNNGSRPSMLFAWKRITVLEDVLPHPFDVSSKGAKVYTLLPLHSTSHAGPMPFLVRSVPTHVIWQ
eukprot:12270521-Prorocentrum_lima.AAC.1